jgi:hypothetical protein
MARWTAFDEESTATVAAHTQAAVSFQRGDALDAALAAEKSALLILPTDSTDVLLLEVRRNSSGRPERLAPVTFEATGFLGLIDEPVFDEEPKPRKKWWQRLLD